MGRSPLPFRKGSLIWGFVYLLTGLAIFTRLATAGPLTSIFSNPLVFLFVLLVQLPFFAIAIFCFLPISGVKYSLKRDWEMVIDDVLRVMPSTRNKNP